LDALTLLSGDAQAFCEKVWATRPLLHETDADALVGLLSLDDVDRLLTASALRTPTVRVVRDGTVLPAAEFTRAATLAGSPLTGLVDGRKVLAHFDAGATVVLQGLHRSWPPLTELVRSLELALGHPCQANAYLTPPGSQGFARHRDTHDVFVFQTHGRKLWEIVEDRTEDGPSREVLLEPGLSMYLPTGTPHSARSQEETSLHVTVGINPITWGDLLRTLATSALAGDEHAQPLPAGYPDDPSRLAEELAGRLAAYTSAVGALDPARVAEEQGHRFLRERTPALRGGLTDLVGLARLDDSSQLERRPTAACVLVDGSETLSVLLGDRELRMPARLRPVMELVRDRPSFRVGDLSPWLDASSRLVVARRLVREGLLRIAG
jgi:bifunctional lysine-specific demethylase and histidyl-hydroxylase NO66